MRIKSFEVHGEMVELIAGAPVARAPPLSVPPPLALNTWLMVSKPLDQVLVMGPKGCRV